MWRFDICVLLPCTCLYLGFCEIGTFQMHIHVVQVKRENLWFGVAASGSLHTPFCKPNHGLGTMALAVQSEIKLSILSVIINIEEMQ